MEQTFLGACLTAVPTTRPPGSSPSPYLSVRSWKLPSGLLPSILLYNSIRSFHYFRLSFRVRCFCQCRPHICLGPNQPLPPINHLYRTRYQPKRLTEERQNVWLSPPNCPDYFRHCGDAGRPIMRNQCTWYLRSYPHSGSLSLTCVSMHTPRGRRNSHSEWSSLRPRATLSWVVPYPVPGSGS